MARFGLAAILLCGTLAGVAQRASADEGSAASPADAFYAGSVVEATASHLAVERTVLGKTETRMFWITAATKIEGRLAPKVRVTVGYVSGETGDTATRIVVRSRTPASPEAKKK